MHMLVTMTMYLVLGFYLVAWGFLFLKIFLEDVLKIFLEDVLAYFRRWIFIKDLFYLFLILAFYLFLILVFYLFSIHYRVREVGHHPLRRQPLPKLGFQFRQTTRSGTT